MADPVLAPDELRARVVRVFQRLTHQPHKASGALTWFAAEAGCSAVTVHRYVTGRSDPATSVEGMRALQRLRDLEIEAGVDDPIRPPAWETSPGSSALAVREPGSSVGLDAALELLRAHRRELMRLGARSLAVYGSVAKGRARSDSDVDILVELEPGFGLFGFQKLRRRLEAILGRKVDLATPEMLHRRLRGAVLTEAVRAI